MKKRLINALGLKILLVAILLLPLVPAPSTLVTQAPSGCQITPISRDILKIGQNFDFNFHVFNLSNGIPLSNTTLDCYFHFYNQTGDHQFATKLTNDPYSEHQVINEWASRMDGGNISTTGFYAYIVQCNGTTLGCADKGYFQVTGNGKAEATGNVVVFFSIIYILMGLLICYMGLYSLGHLLKLDFDLKDLGLNWGMFFATVIIYYLQDVYMGDAGVSEWLLLMVQVAGIIFVLVPIIAFILSLMIGTLNKRSINAGQPPRKMYRL